MSEPLVSIIMPNYNGSLYLIQALDSIIAQSYKNIEIIVVDDGSTDNSLEILHQYAAKTLALTVITQNNAGVADARNTGIVNAKGDYIAFLDSDDFWHPEKLTLQVNFLEEKPNYAACYSSFLVWSPNTDKQYQEPNNMYTTVNVQLNSTLDESFSGWIYHLLLKDVYVWTGTIIIRKEVFDDIGFFSKKLKIGEDHDLWLRIADKYQLAKLQFPTALYRTNPISVTKSVHDKNYAAIVVEDSIKTRGLKSKNGKGISAKNASDIVYELWFRYAYQCFWSSEFELAHEAFKRSLKHCVSIKAIVYYFFTFKLVSPLIKWMVKKHV